MATDKLSPPPSPSRVFYSLGRMLGVEDFQADQDYHRGSLARALLQVCGTGTVAGLKVLVPQIWQAGTAYPTGSFVYDGSQNVQLNTGATGISGSGPLTFATAVGGTVNDANGIVWTNQGPLGTAQWNPKTTYAKPKMLRDSNGNIQILTVNTLTSGPNVPVWNTAVGSTTQDGNPAQAAWTCAGPADLEILVTAGLAIDRVGRMIEVPQPVCIFLQPWMTTQSAADLTNALQGGNILVDVFATFVPCTQGVTPCFASQDNYDATDAFSANRLLDSFAMQLVLRTDKNPRLPLDPWLALGAPPTGGVTSAVLQALQQNILAATSGPAATAPFATNGVEPAEYPQQLDPSSVFLARISIPATAATTAGQPPTYNLSQLSINNLARLFVYPLSMTGRTLGLGSGASS